MARAHLSDVFKFVHSFGQRGHQIGRKIGDALELVTLGMVARDCELMRHLVIENGVEGATGAEHKVEFAFYNLGLMGVPIAEPDKLFGMIECKKVGVEATTQTGFKTWLSRNLTKRFCDTSGYEFNQRSASGETRAIRISAPTGSPEVHCTVNGELNVIPVGIGDRLLIVSDVEDEFYVLGPGTELRSVNPSIQRCLIVTVKKVDSLGVSEITVDDCLAGPQTPEKAKQASFVSLDVRKRVLGTFDRTERDEFVSVLVIGEASHWEEKSRSMIRLCNDFNLTVPDHVIVQFFERMLELFGDRYQDKIKKSSYQSDATIKHLVETVINDNGGRVLFDLNRECWVSFKFESVAGSGRLRVVELE